MANDKANWQNVNIETLPADIRKDYDNYKKAYSAMKDMRDRFEGVLRDALADHTPKGKRLAIAYNFGKLSVAIVDDNEKRPSAKSISLADLVRR